MGQKVNPHGFRVGVIKDWDTRWYANKKDFADYLIEDYKIREFIKDKHFAAGISKIEIERAVNKVTVNIHSGKPGIIIGRGGAGVETVKAQLAKLTGKAINVNIIEVRHADVDAQLVAENVASQLERRISFRRAMKQTIGRAMKAGAKGIRIKCSGRLGGAEIARNESYHEGSIPLQTLRADITYGFAEAKTTYGRIGVKVWIYHGELLGGRKAAMLRTQQKDQQPQGRGERRPRSRKPAEGGK